MRNSKVSIAGAWFACFIVACGAEPNSNADSEVGAATGGSSTAAGSGNAGQSGASTGAAASSGDGTTADMASSGGGIGVNDGSSGGGGQPDDGSSSMVTAGDGASAPGDQASASAADDSAGAATGSTSDVTGQPGGAPDDDSAGTDDSAEQPSDDTGAMPDDSTDEMPAVDDGSAEPDPPVVVELPELVTSGEGNYWQEGQLSEASGNATVTVNESDTKQVWMGFGGTFNEAGWDALSVLSEADKQLAIDLLFDAQSGANFKWGRIPMGASDYATTRYTLAETPNDFAMDDFSIERDRQMLIPFIKAALSAKSDVRLWASPWSPPAWMKTNNDINGLTGDSEASMKSDPEILDAYSLYFAKFVEEYAAEGLVIEHVEPQNEPGYATRYPSCLWSPNLLRDFIRDYLGPTFVERGLTTEIWLGTMSAPEDTAHLDAVRNDSAANQFIKGYGLQWNTMGSVGTLASTGNPVIQTEHKCGNYHWETTFNPDQPPNDHAYGVESWELIRDWLQAGVHIYSAWNMVLDTYGHNSDEERPWPQNALLVVDRSAGTLRATAAYHVFRHLSAFVQPGATRLGTTGGDALAFKNPDDSIVAVVHNSGGQTSSTTLSAGGRTVQFDVPARGWATVNLD